MHMVMQDVATALESTLDLPSILPHGARVDPTADGFLIWLPTCEVPSCSPDLLPDSMLNEHQGSLRSGLSRPGLALLA